MTNMLQTILLLMNDMSKAATMIDELWTNLPQEEFDKLAEEYPFDESFDEMAAKIRAWVEHHKK